MSAADSTRAHGMTLHPGNVVRLLRFNADTIAVATVAQISMFGDWVDVVLPDGHIFSVDPTQCIQLVDTDYILAPSNA